MKKIIKKLIKITFIIWIFITIWSYVFALDWNRDDRSFPYLWVENEEVNEADKTDMSIIMDQDIVDPQEWFVQRILWVLWLSDFAHWTQEDWSWNTQWGTNYIKYIVNIGIALSAFIALLFIIYWFAKMFASNWWEAYESAVKIIKNSAIAIVIIWISRIIVWFFFYVYNITDDVQSQDNQITTQQNNIEQPQYTNPESNNQPQYNETKDNNIKKPTKNEFNDYNNEYKSEWWVEEQFQE